MFQHEKLYEMAQKIKAPEEENVPGEAVTFEEIRSDYHRKEVYFCNVQKHGFIYVKLTEFIKQ